MTQGEANKLPYNERYRRYLAWHKAKRPVGVPYSYKGWLKYFASANVPADCRPGQGKEPWQRECNHLRGVEVPIPEDNTPLILSGVCIDCGKLVQQVKGKGWVVV